MAAVAASAMAWAGQGVANASGLDGVIDMESPAEISTVPTVTPLRIRNGFDDLAVRPDGTIVVATQANWTYTNKPARPAAGAVRFGPHGEQLPSLTLVAPAVRAQTTQAAVTERGAVVSWSAPGKIPAALVSEITDDGVATAPQLLSTPGLAAGPVEAASGGDAAAVLLTEGKPTRRASIALRLAYRAPAATAFTTASVPVRRGARAFSEYRLVIGAAGDGAIIAWSNEHHVASLWRIGRDGAVGPEIPVQLSKGYTDTALAVGGDGTIGATFAAMNARKPDEVMVAQIPPGTSTLAPAVRIKASDGGSLSTQGVGLAVSPTGSLLVSVADSGGSQVILEGSGRTFTKTYVPYIGGASTVAAWMPDGSAVVVLESDDPSAYPSVTRLFSIRHALGAAFGAPRQIGPELSPGAEWSSLLALVPAADGSAALAWQLYDGHRNRLAVARITP